MVAGPYLVDTSTLIWVPADSKRLSAKAGKALHAGPLVFERRQLLGDRAQGQKGSLDIADPVHWWSRATDLSGGVILSIRPALLVAQAVSEGLVIITSDEKVCDYPVTTLW